MRLPKIIKHKEYPIGSVTKISSTLQILFGQPAQKLGQVHQLVQRNSKLSASLMAVIVVSGYLEQPTANYSDPAQVAFDLGLSITKQGLQNRLSSVAAGVYFKALLAESLGCLQTKLNLESSWLNWFKGIYLHDSTHLNLPKGLAAQYPSSAYQSKALGSGAALKLQITWNWLNGQFSHLTEQVARSNDQSFKWQGQTLASESVLIFDLGYFVLATFQTLTKAGIWWVSRLNLNCPLFWAAEGQALDLLAYLQACQTDQVELAVLVSRKSVLPARLIAIRLPQAVQEQWLRRARAAAKRKGCSLTDQKRAWQAWSVYLTSLPKERATTTQVVLLYRLRWQIELVFKLTKSLAGLEQFSTRTESSTLVQLYAKLIGLVLFYYLATPHRLVQLAGSQRELSLPQAWHTLSPKAIDLAKALLALSDIDSLLKYLASLWGRFCLMDKRSGRSSSSQLLEQQTLSYQSRP